MTAVDRLSDSDSVLKSAPELRLYISSQWQRLFVYARRVTNRTTSLVQSARSYSPLLALPVNPFDYVSESTGKDCGGTGRTSQTEPMKNSAEPMPQKPTLPTINPDHTAREERLELREPERGHHAAPPPKRRQAAIQAASSTPLRHPETLRHQRTNHL
jgi:hypothetical protein